MMDGLLTRENTDNELDLSVYLCFSAIPPFCNVAVNHAARARLTSDG